MSVGIYCIENTLNGKKYIGQSVNLESRFCVHKSLLGNKRHYNPYLQHAYDKNGEEVFSFCILQECDEDELDRLESQFIEKFDTRNPERGYNIIPGGTKPPSREGIHWSDEERAEISARFMGEKNPRYGKKATEETRRRLSESHIGYVWSEESKRKLSNTNTGRTISELHRQHISDSKVGYKYPNSSSKYIGVSRYKNRTWICSITVNRKRIHIGYFKDEVDAARAYDKKAIELLGESAKLNFPQLTANAEKHKD